MADTLFEIEKNGEYSTFAILDKIKDFDARDKGFVNEIVLGVLRNKIYLDYVIQSFSKIKLKKLNPYVLQILRSGAYQILFMDKIPDSAACNEAVKLAEKKAHSAKGFVNGVLRSISRGKNDLKDIGGNDEERLSLIYSCPLWLTEKLLLQYGKDVCVEILKDSLKPHPTFIRVNSLKTNKEELEKLLKNEGTDASLEKDVDGCLKINGALNVSASDLYKNGYYTIQNINSQRTVQALNPKSGDFVIDMCAAPGGKTTHMAECMKNVGNIKAFDIYEHKIKLIEALKNRLGITCIDEEVWNSQEVKNEYINMADCVLADVPCSGIGVIHRKPDIKYNRKESDIEELTKVQKKILDTASKYVKVGGSLVYSTCTILKEENENITDGFLKMNNNFEKKFEKLYLAHKTGGSGFYICKMIRKK